jgi:TRAP-type mannitol/chloroaromatic compound transport system permease small subunit
LPAPARTAPDTVRDIVGGLLTISRVIDAFNQKLAIFANLLVLAAALVSAFNAALRYGLRGLIDLSREYHFLSGLETFIKWYGNNSNAFLEAQWYMFGAMVMFGAAYTLKVNEHVRVDLIYGLVSERTRTWIDLLGGILFLMPMCVILIYFTWPWFLDAWRTGETSANSGGLVRWPVKFLLPLGFGLVALQGISEIIKCVAALTTNYHREYAYEKPLQ